MKKWGIALTLIGAAVLVLSVVLAAILGAVGLGGSTPDEGEVVAISGPTTIPVAADESMFLYHAETGPSTSCGIFDPSGQMLTDASSLVTSSFTHEGETYTSFAEFGGSGMPAGDYVVECDQDGIIAAPAVDAAGIVGGVFGILGGVFGGFLGFALLVVGVVLWIVGARRMQRSH
ncbi:hypothetical protein GCM10022261_20510 [Brevibacterium daeguense]|uniref:Uncharacterized protein n=1 Tax=Brevibacterium daeguense TaxID=909936 RepID=A0ABP8EKY0_9MICO|nr:hypothetical protein [Brevibacterium daeguense]